MCEDRVVGLSGYIILHKESYATYRTTKQIRKSTAIDRPINYHVPARMYS